MARMLLLTGQVECGPEGRGVDLEVGGFFGLVLLVLDVYAIVKVVGSGASTGKKVLWIVLILLLPLLGLILWALLGPKK